MIKQVLFFVLLILSFLALAEDGDVRQSMDNKKTNGHQVEVERKFNGYNLAERGSNSAESVISNT